MKTTHEEADNILAQQMVISASQPNNGVCVVSDDTDVFVLFLYFYAKYNLTGFVIMETTVKDRATIDIKSTISANKDNILGLPAAHALSGSDTTACHYGKGKRTVVNILQTKLVTLSSIGDLTFQFEDVLKEVTNSIAACYKMLTDGSDMISVRGKVWASRVGKAPSCAPKLHSLPPTSEVFCESVKRVHLQTCTWKHAVDTNPPDLDAVDCGWTKDVTTKTLVPVMLPKNVQFAPEDVLKLIKFSCESQSPCGSLKCTCNKARLSCTIFCTCQGTALCCNEQTRPQ